MKIKKESISFSLTQIYLAAAAFSQNREFTHVLIFWDNCFVSTTVAMKTVSHKDKGSVQSRFEGTWKKYFQNNTFTKISQGHCQIRVSMWRCPALPESAECTVLTDSSPLHVVTGSRRAVPINCICFISLSQSHWGILFTLSKVTFPLRLFSLSTYMGHQTTTMLKP